MRVMQASVYMVVDVVTMRYSFVPTVRAVRVRALGSRSVLRRIRGIDREDMLVNMIPMHVVEMAVMKIVNMAVMANSRVPAVRAMLVGMVGMVRLGAGDHEIPPSCCDPGSLLFGGMSYRELHDLDYLGVRIGIEDVLVSGAKAEAGRIAAERTVRGSGFIDTHTLARFLG